MFSIFVLDEGTSPVLQLREPVLLQSACREEAQAAAAVAAAAAAAALPEVPKVTQCDGKKPLPGLNTSNNMTLETATRSRNNNTTHTHSLHCHPFYLC